MSTGAIGTPAAPPCLRHGLWRDAEPGDRPGCDSVGICARAYGTACVHEHACVRCSLLRPDPAQRDRLVEIRDNLIDRITEAEREGWLGALEAREVSLAGAQDKLAQLDAEQTRRSTAVDLGVATFRDIADRHGSAPLQP